MAQDLAPHFLPQPTPNPFLPPQMGWVSSRRIGVNVVLCDEKGAPRHSRLFRLSALLRALPQRLGTRAD